MATRIKRCIQVTPTVEFVTLYDEETTFGVWSGTQAEFDALASLDPDVFYYVIP